MAAEAVRIGAEAIWGGEVWRGWAARRTARWAAAFAMPAGIAALYPFGVISGATAAALALGGVVPAAIVGAAALAFRWMHAGLAGHLDILAQAFDLTPDARLIVAPDGRAASANLAFDRMFPGPGEPPLDRLARSLAADPEAGAELRRLREAAAAPRPWCATLGGRRVSVIPLSGCGGCSVWTIADRALEPGPESRPARSLEHFRRLFTDAPIGIALVDGAGRFVEANRAVGELFGATAAALVGRQLTDLLAESERDGVAARLGDAMAAATDSGPIEIRIEQPQECRMVLFANRLTGEMLGGAGALALHFIDVTEQKNLEIQFAQSQKMQAVGRLAGGVAHDFNNLLTAMIGFCDLLLLRFPPGDPSFADLMQIKQNANRAANLVRQLLAFARQQTLQPRVLDVTDVLVELSHLLRRLIGENIELDLVHGSDLGLVKVDESQLEQVVINLAVNARDAMPNGGKLTIRTRNLRQEQPLRRGHEVLPAGDYILIEVADTGVGIAKDHLARIFDPFFSTKEVGSGTGLGLSMVDGIVKQTGGFVFVDSIPDRGTAFEIYLPRHRPAPGSPQHRPDSAEPAAPRDLTGIGTILLVEDDDPVRIFGARALRNRGYRVIEAKGGAAALDAIRDGAEKVDLLITDVVMPQMDGPSLAREAREIDPEIKVIFISGYAEDAFRQRLDREGDIHFVPKPFTLKQLTIKVKEVIGGVLP
jgi:two-component system cell cycle sensor histidine kinase/response regulator CckA